MNKIYAIKTKKKFYVSANPISNSYQPTSQLEHLMALINEPMVQCDKCEGVGYLKGGSNE